MRRHDRREGTATVIARQADGPSHAPTVADDGRVAFVSAATNLTDDWDHNGFAHVYEWPGRDEGIVALSVDEPRGAQANADSHAPSISANGAAVAYASPATNLTPTTASGGRNVFVHAWSYGGMCLAFPVSAAPPA